MRSSIVWTVLFFFTVSIIPIPALEIGLNFMSPRAAYAELYESIEDTCPSDPTQNGKCALDQTTVDGPSCKTIGGQEVCKDWWRKDFTYKCSGSFDPDTILAKVGTQYCDYTNECTEWLDVEKHGGDTSCRIYVDVNRPGCGSDPFSYDCVVNDCGDLFDRCTMKQYIKYSDIPDRINMTGDINCNTYSWQCGSQVGNSTKSGVKLGIYNFNCPAEVRQVCKSYSGKVKCPDGREQVCNRVKTCKDQQSVSRKTLEQKSCAALRDMQAYSYIKNSADSAGLKSNSMCIKTGEADGCTAAGGCVDNGSYGTGFFVRNGPDWGYVEMWGVDASAKQVKVHAYAAGGLGQCGDLTTTISTDSPPGTVVGSVYPNWGDGNCHEVVVTYEGYTCPGGCIHTFKFTFGGEVYTVNVPMAKPMENFNCYQDSYKDCTFDNGLQCNRLSSPNINDLECVGYDNDTEDPRKSLCKQYIVNYECPTTAQTTECSRYEEVVKCNDGIYPLRDVRADSYDFSADFAQAMALAQATNELKHVWSGEPYECESGMWWLFDSMSFGDYLMSKVMSAAFQQLGGALMAKTGITSAISDGMGCMSSVQSAVFSFYKAAGDIRPEITKAPDNSAMQVTIPRPSGGEEYTIDTSKSKGCVAAIGQKLGGALGLAPDQIGKVTDFFSNTYVTVALSVLVDIATSIKNCSTCTDEKCATKYNEYKAYSMVFNKLCHLVANKCTSEMFLLGCMRTGYKHCCYNSLFARVLVEESYKQLGYSWGDYDNPTCTNLTFDDLKRLDFKSMDLSEFLQDVEAKMKGKLDESALQQKVKDRIAIPQ